VGLGLARVVPGRPEAGALLSVLVALVGVAAGEELVMRGVVLQQVARGWGVPTGLAVSAGLFGLLHLPNLLATDVEPAVLVIGMVVLVLLGLVFALGFLVTRALWLPIALHLSWNAAQGPLYGFPISGRPSEGLLHTVVVGPAWITGGAFGPEGGLVGLVAIALAAAAVAAYGRWRAAQGLRRPPAPDRVARP
jgi:membrane protease YdiL (CAAX protease family)